MKSLEEELHDFVGRELHELAWRLSYPIYPGIALWCFLEGFHSHGAHVELVQRDASISFTRLISERLYHLQTRLTFDEILDGWKWNPRGSPISLYDSICLVYDRIGENIPCNLSQDWSNIREKESREVRKNMEKHLIDFFLKYHEHILMPVNGNPLKLEKPRIIHEVLADYPIDMLRNAIALNVSPPATGMLGMISPCAETLLEIDWDFDLSEYHPSEAVMIDFFWGKYLDRLVKEKGYELQHKGSQLRQLVSNGAHALKRGDLLWEIKR